MAALTPRYTLAEIAGLAGVTPRTVRYYVAQGLLPSPGSVGPGAKYDDGHLDRLRLIRRLQREHLPLAEIRRRLAGLDDVTVAALADEPSAEAAAPPDTALEYIRRVLTPPPRPQPARLSASLARRIAAPPRLAETATPYAAGPPALASPAAPETAPERRIQRAQWERIGLTPDIELHVRRPLSRPLAKQVDRLVAIARDLLEEDPS
jgi:DNA-binding transcriptional MerR regulator